MLQITLLEVPVECLVIDESRSPDRDERTILEHLIRYFTKFDRLPTLMIELQGGEAIVVGRHKYLLAARALGWHSLQAIVEGKPSSEELRSFIARTGSKELDWQAIRAAEDLELARDPCPLVWFVYYFARPLSAEEKTAFNAAVASYFTYGPVHVTHDDSGPLAEFEARMFVADERVYGAHLGTFLAFHQSWVPIVSFQGGRFGPWPSVGSEPRR